jgi:septal ring-binding cell division protein DamX
MNKSQVRLLADEMANGEITAGEYRARRRELIDNIVAGTAAIERVAPVWQVNALGGDDEKTTLKNGGESVPRTRAERRFAVPLSLLLVAGVVACVVIITALLWPAAEPPPLVTHAVPAVPQAEKIAASRALAESFVARRDFGADAIAAFSRDWQGIDAAEREQVRGKLWFSSLVHALSNEIKTQKALAGLADGGVALQRAQAAFALGEFLGVSDQLPSVDNVALQPGTGTDANTDTGAATEPEPNSDTAAAAPAYTLTQSPSQSQSSSASPSPLATPTIAAPNGSAATSGQALTGRQWLATNTNDQLTLQIFAVNNLNRVEELIGAHLTLDVHVLATEGAEPRYRVFHGVYADEESARQAYAALPASITKASHGAIVKSFSVVRDDLRGLTTTTAPSASTSTTGKADAFTLQMFATGNRETAQALVQAFPALKLQLREISGDAAPYRVVHGDYSSAARARSAALTLPQELLARIGGAPLAKELSALGTLAQP